MHIYLRVNFLGETFGEIPQIMWLGKAHCSAHVCTLISIHSTYMITCHFPQLGHVSFRPRPYLAPKKVGIEMTRPKDPGPHSEGSVTRPRYNIIHKTNENRNNEENEGHMFKTKETLNKES